MKAFGANAQFKVTPEMHKAMKNRAAELKIAQATAYRLAVAMFLEYGLAYATPPQKGDSHEKSPAA